jgi:hypothetical protein
MCWNQVSRLWLLLSFSSGNAPPIIEGDFTLFVNANVEAVAIFRVRDRDNGDSVDTFMCLVSVS